MLLNRDKFQFFCTILYRSVCLLFQIQSTVVGEDAEMGPAGRLNKLQLLQYHQAVLESQTRAWLQAQDGHEVNIPKITIINTIFEGLINE